MGKDTTQRPRLRWIGWSWFTVMVIALIGFVSVMAWAFLYRMFVAPPVNPHIEQTDALVREGDQIQLNILNGCGRQGAARTTMDYLRARGFDVVEIANYNSFEIKSSYIIDRVGDSLSSAKVAYALGVADSLITVDIDSTLFLRCSVILGTDWETLKPFIK